MIVKELIEILSEIDPNLVVVTPNLEDYASEPSPNIKKLDFDTSYWSSNINLIKIPANTKFVEL